MRNFKITDYALAQDAGVYLPVRELVSYAGLYWTRGYLGNIFGRFYDVNYRFYKFKTEIWVNNQIG